MPTTVLATALPALARRRRPVPAHRVPHAQAASTATLLSDFPAAADWPATLAGCTFALDDLADPGRPCRCVSCRRPTPRPGRPCCRRAPPVAGFPTPALSDETWHTYPASRISDHAVDLHLAAITAAPARRPALAGDPVAGGCCGPWRTSTSGGPLRRLLEDAPGRARRAPPGRRRGGCATR